MNIEDLDLASLSKLTSDFIDEHKCLECCKYYLAPSTSSCGHTLCHTCWMGRHTCPECATTIKRKTLKPNIPFQTLTHHVQTLGEAFEKLFNVKLDEFNLDTLGEVESEKDPDKNVKYWLTSSQNQFSAPIHTNEEHFSQASLQPNNPVNVSPSNVIIHTDPKKVISPKKLPKVTHVTPQQDDWDKIEQMPDVEDIAKTKENVVGPMDIEPFFIDNIEYTTNNPRRSSRNKNIECNDSNQNSNELCSNKQILRDSISETDKKSQKGKQTWNNVKRMRKEFSKLSKTNRNKLNVSIEMFKKTQKVKPISNEPKNVMLQDVNIDESTPDNIVDKENNFVSAHSNNQINNIPAPNSCNVDKNSIDDEPKIAEQQNSSKNLVLSENTKDSENIDQDNSISKHISISILDKIVNDSKNDLNKNTDISQNKMPFIKKGALCPRKIEVVNIDSNLSKLQTDSGNCEDIEISIKIGTTITNILIKKKNDVQVKVNTDREIQTSMTPDSLDQNKSPQERYVCNIDGNMNSNEIINVENDKINVTTSTKNQLTAANIDKSISEKKNTASAETATVQFEITESVEKELSNIMEYETAGQNEDVPKSITSVAKVQPVSTVQHDNVHTVEELNDLDIFNSGSVKEPNVQVLKEHAPSEILIPTIGSKLKTQRNVEKRLRDNSENSGLPKNKKVKVTSPQTNEENILTDSEPINYDVIMGQVFASIDADIGKKHDTESIKNTLDNSTNKEIQLKNNILSEAHKTQINKLANHSNTQMTTTNLQEYFNEKDSENIFSVIEKDDENCVVNKNQIPQHVEDLLTPVLSQNIDSTQESHDGVNKTNKSNKRSQDYDYSDRSVVEETPQKNLSVSKPKRASTSNLSQITVSDTKKIPSNPCVQEVRSIISLTDTEFNKSNRDVTIIDTAGKKHTLETPLNITKFADHIIHKSTPVARKSLNFDKESEHNDDPEETLCPTFDVIAKTTQEKEFMRKAFEVEVLPTTPVAKPLMARRNVMNTNRKYCLACSCLTSAEIANVKTLCAQRKWSYVDKYSKDITHLVVGVDNENKSQRSVKYMCALAASKWIVSFEWINKCLQSKDIVDEEYFEALDTFGEPGPRRSRITKQKLFQGIKFYCMQPFSVLDVDTLKSMLIAAGGLVVNDMREVAVAPGSTEPALLLAEPEHTQEDRFIYLAMEKSIVPVNYEWVLNCLGSYMLSSIQELLLCPSSLLPEATARWPDVLLNQD